MNTITTLNQKEIVYVAGGYEFTEYLPHWDKDYVCTLAIGASTGVVAMIVFGLVTLRYFPIAYQLVYNKIGSFPPGSELPSRPPSPDMEFIRDISRPSSPSIA